MREPYGKDTRQIDEFAYEEGVDGKDHSKYLWGNAAYALAARLTKSFAKYGWCAAIRGVENGGLVEGLATHNFRTDEGDVALEVPHGSQHYRPPREGACRPGICAAGALQGDGLCRLLQRADGQQAQGLRQAGGQCQRQAFGPVAVHAGHVPFCALSEGDDARQAGQHDEPLPGRAFPESVDRELRDRGRQCVPAAKAEKPLREARIEVMEIPGKPGALRAVAFLRPHFQLDELTVSLRLVADLPQPAGK
jgi:type VI secretion system protein ImpC